MNPMDSMDPMDRMDTMDSMDGMNLVAWMDRRGPTGERTWWTAWADGPREPERIAACGKGDAAGWGRRRRQLPATVGRLPAKLPTVFRPISPMGVLGVPR